MKRINITDQEHDAFVKAHPNGDLLQLTKWGDTKKLTGWYAKRIAVGENGELKGVGQLLFKRFLAHLLRFVMLHAVSLWIIRIPSR